MTVETIEIALSVPASEAQTVLDELSSIPDADPFHLPSVGAEGGGAIAVLVASLSKATIRNITKIIHRLLGGSEVKIVIGKTTLEGKNLRNADLEALLEKVADAEIRRATLTK